MRIRFDRSISLQTVAIAALLAFAPMHSAHAQNSDANARLQRMEKEIQTLSRAIFKGETPPVESFSANDASNATTQTRLDQIENDLRALTGKIEEQSYQIGRLQDLEIRLAALEGRGGSATISQPQIHNGPGSIGMMTRNPVGTPPQPQVHIPEDAGFVMGNDPDAPAAIDSPSSGQLGQMGGAQDSVTAAYEAAYTMLRNQDYAGAETAFEGFIRANPDSALIPNALYWLGETYYVRNDFDKAARTFAEAYQKYPDGAKAPDNLLKLAMALNGQGKTQDACVALAQLKKQYPAGAAPVLTRADQEIARLGCK